MAYGTANGVTNNLVNYQDLIAASKITVAMIAEVRVAGDGIIDMYLSRSVARTNLPLANPPAVVDSISDDLATYYLLRRVFTGKDPDDSVWVDKFYKRPLELLDVLADNPSILEDAAGNSLVEVGVEASTEDYDPVFGFERTSDGDAVTGDYDESMEDW